MSAIQEGPRSVKIEVLPISQPIGGFFIGVMTSEKLCEITDFDVRRLVGEWGFETYLGIQRPLDRKRVKQIQQCMFCTRWGWQPWVLRQFEDKLKRG